MLAKLGIFLITVSLIAYLIYKIGIQNTFVMSKRLDKVREDARPDLIDGDDVISELIESGRLYKIPLIGSFYQKQIESLSVANIQMKPKEYLLTSVGASITLFLVGSMITGQIILGPVFGVIGMLVPNFYVNHLKSKREGNLNEQLPEFLNTLSNALRSGLSLQQSIRIAVEEAQDPVKWEFEKVLNDMAIGRTTADAFDELRIRTKNENINLLVNSISVQMDVGGNLSEILDLLAGTIRENAKLQRYFKSTVAQNKLSGIIIGLLPVGLTGFLTLMNPEYMSPLFTDPVGRLMILGAVMMMGSGLFIVKKITELEV